LAVSGVEIKASSPLVNFLLAKPFPGLLDPFRGTIARAHWPISHPP